jgi:hypothetical protein
MSEFREDELRARLRALAAADAERSCSAAVRARVMRAWDERQHGSTAPRRFSLQVWLPVVASLAIVVGLMIGSIYQSPPPRTRSEPTMLTLPDASVLPRFDHGEFIRVEIPSPAGAIQAEVLIGQDGLARGIRVIQ